MREPVARREADAVFAVSDSLAAGALRPIAQAGLRVPEDIAVIGFDGTGAGGSGLPAADHRRTALADIGARRCLY